MKTEKNILLAFILNLSFSVFEVIGGLFTGSVAILSDALHDFGDSLSIGISFFLEKKSKKRPDERHTYGYAAYSVIGGAITTLILLLGSLLVIAGAIRRLFFPTDINYGGMIIFAVIGTAVNIAAAFFTHGKESLNQRAVSLHMLEDALGWVAVLIGAVIMRFTAISIIDPIVSICIAVFILVNAIRNLKDISDVFLFKTPSGISSVEIGEHLCGIRGILDVHHIHVWTDGRTNYATMHVVSSGDAHHLKSLIREELSVHGISHVTVEFEAEGEDCTERLCHTNSETPHHHHHHHHH